MKTTFQKLTVFFTAVALPWGCSSNDNPAQPQQGLVEVMIVSNTFVPAEVTITSGNSVRWTNEDDVQMENDFHTVDSGTAENPTNIFTFTFSEKDATAQHTFNSAGTFPYYCRRHGETGKVIVQ